MKHYKFSEIHCRCTWKVLLVNGFVQIGFIVCDLSIELEFTYT